MFLLKNKNKTIYLIAGLGNPGPEYANTRHNCGYRTVDLLYEKIGTRPFSLKFKSFCTEVKRENDTVILLKPATYMNNSGDAIYDVMRYYKIDQKNVIIIYDDTDIEIGKLRVRSKGSAGTHNGMKSVLEHMEGDEFPRIRIGIGKRRDNEDMVHFVLGSFPKAEEDIMNDSFIRAADCALDIIDHGIDKAMNMYN